MKQLHSWLPSPQKWKPDLVVTINRKSAMEIGMPMGTGGAPDPVFQIFFIFGSRENFGKSCMKFLCLFLLLVIGTSFLVPFSCRVRTRGAINRLENRNWELKELRFLQGNDLHYYQQNDPVHTTMNFDHDYYRFNSDGSGIYHQRDGKEFALKWDFAKGESCSIIFQISNFSQNKALWVTWEKIQLAGDTISYLEHYTHANGLQSIGYGTRVAAKTAVSNQQSPMNGRP